MDLKHIRWLPSTAHLTIVSDIGDLHQDPMTAIGIGI
jgi:hypothetical protein